ncbi:lysine/ornithine N-monooxygenase [Paraburkholderia caledonica]|uniref:Lysine/ornithine N-monooxygenase n=1 Tax=Paraburkholderia caledonica TaxID=134536 RepID=A0ABU1KZ17_9BURK|nr:lysine/ornithine N-monooxygenase [Paraburkholderia caledonica]
MHGGLGQPSLTSVYVRAAHIDRSIEQANQTKNKDESPVINNYERRFWRRFI